MVLEMRYYGDPVLRAQAQKVTGVDDSLRELADAMAEKMYEANGIGLAANQIGDLRQILVIDVTEADDRRGKSRQGVERNPEVYLNPEILESSEEDEAGTEGCLSIPGIEAEVYRPLRIKLRWTNLNGETQEAEFSDLHARVLQHEIDHLNGVLFVDHLGLIQRRKLAGKLNRLKQETLKKLDGESA